MTDHLIDLNDLPEWGPDVPGVPVEVEHASDDTELFYGWREGSSTFPKRSLHLLIPWDVRRVLRRLVTDPDYPPRKPTPPEPPHDALLVDRDGDRWRWRGAWEVGTEDAAKFNWATLHAKYSPITVHPKGEVIP